MGQESISLLQEGEQPGAAAVANVEIEGGGVAGQQQISVAVSYGQGQSAAAPPQQQMVFQVGGNGMGGVMIAGGGMVMMPQHSMEQRMQTAFQIQNQYMQAAAMQDPNNQAYYANQQAAMAQNMHFAQQAMLLSQQQQQMYQQPMYYQQQQQQPMQAPPYGVPPQQQQFSAPPPPPQQQQQQQQAPPPSFAAAEEEERKALLLVPRGTNPNSSRLLGLRFFFAFLMSLAFWATLIAALALRGQGKDNIWPFVFIGVGLCWIGGLVEGQTDKSRRSLSTPMTPEDLSAYCQQLRSTMPYYEFTVVCWHTETRTRTVRDANGNMRTETYTVTVTTYRGSYIITPRFSVDASYGEGEICKPTIVSFRLDVQPGDEKALRKLHKYRTMLYLMNCWRDVHCDVSYAPKMPNWLGRYAAIFMTEYDKSKASGLHAMVVIFCIMTFSWIARLILHSIFGASMRIQIVKRVFFTKKPIDISRLLVPAPILHAVPLDPNAPPPASRPGYFVVPPPPAFEGYQHPVLSITVPEEGGANPHAGKVWYQADPSSEYRMVPQESAPVPSEDGTIDLPIPSAPPAQEEGEGGEGGEGYEMQQYQQQQQYHQQQMWNYQQQGQGYGEEEEEEEEEEGEQREEEDEDEEHEERRESEVEEDDERRGGAEGEGGVSAVSITDDGNANIHIEVNFTGKDDGSATVEATATVGAEIEEKKEEEKGEEGTGMEVQELKTDDPALMTL